MDQKQIEIFREVLKNEDFLPGRKPKGRIISLLEEACHCALSVGKEATWYGCFLEPLQERLLELYYSGDIYQHASGTKRSDPTQVLESLQKGGIYIDKDFVKFDHLRKENPNASDENLSKIVAAKMIDAYTNERAVMLLRNLRRTQPKAFKINEVYKILREFLGTCDRDDLHFELSGREDDAPYIQALNRKLKELQSNLLPSSRRERRSVSDYQREETTKFNISLEKDPPTVDVDKLWMARNLITMYKLTLGNASIAYTQPNYATEFLRGFLSLEPQEGRNIFLRVNI